MAEYTKEQLINSVIKPNIKTNGNGEITGQKLQDVLVAMVQNLESATASGGTGTDGVGIATIEGTRIVDTIDNQPRSGLSLTINLTDSTSRGPFKIYDGAAGAQGPKGESGSTGPEGPQGPQGPSGSSFNQEAFDNLETEMNNFFNILSGNINSISANIAGAASDAVGEALANLNLTAEELNNLRNTLSSAATNAQNALDLLRDLTGGDGEIDPEALQEALLSIHQVQNWINNVSGGIQYIQADYDAEAQRAGLIGEGGIPSRGLLSWFGESLSTLSGTVGTVRRDMDASNATITDIATWYSENEHSFTSAWTAIDAMNGRIDSVVDFATESAVTQALISIDGRVGEIVQMINSMSGFSGEIITSLSNRMSAAEALIEQAIDRQGGLSGDIISIRNRLEAVSGSLETYITKTDSALTMARDMRETWTQEEGMLRTVSDLVIRKDEDGFDIYWYDDPTDEIEKRRVYFGGKSGDGRTYFTENSDGSGNIYFDNVYPDYMTGMFSYIQQTVGSINMGVSSGDVLAAFSMSATPDGSRIYMTADRVLIDSEVYARAISARTANIGGISFGNGIICGGTPTTGGPWWAIDGYGNAFFSNAVVSGNVYATNGVFKGDVYANNGHFKGSVSADSGYFNGTVYATDGQFRGAITATSLTLGEGVHIDIQPEDVGIDTSEFFKKDDVWSGAGGTEFIVSRDGLLKARNAIISGNVYADNSYFRGTVHAKDGDFKGSVSADSGYFHGRIEAEEGYFRGSVSADSGYFNHVSASNINIKGSMFEGDITANSLTLNGKLFSGVSTDGFVELDKIYGALGRNTSGVSVSQNGLLMASNAVISGNVYATNGVFNGTVYAKNGKFNGAVSATSLHLGDVTYNTSDEFIVLGDEYKNGTGVNNQTLFTVGTGGLLTARNAIISGNVYATNGVFKGDVYAENGYFKGELKAAKGSFSGAVTATTLRLGNKDITSIPSTDGFVQLDEVYGTLGRNTSGVVVSETGLLMASNAIISGTVYATNGVFNGDVYADNGYFNGDIHANNISADTGYFAGFIRMPFTFPGTAYTATTGNCYLFYDSVTGRTKTLKLPAGDNELNGLTYEIIVEGSMVSNTTNNYGVKVSLVGNGSIKCCAFWEVYTSTTFTLKGGRYTFTCVGSQWYLTTATGEVQDAGGVCLAPLFAANYGGSTMINKVVTYSGSKPTQDGAYFNYDRTLFIQEPVQNS